MEKILRKLPLNYKQNRETKAIARERKTARRFNATPDPIAPLGNFHYRHRYEPALSWFSLQLPDIERELHSLFLQQTNEMGATLSLGKIVL